MIIVRCLFLMLFATCFHGSDALAADFAAPLASHNFFTPELKPSPDSFKLAKSTFLPETYDDLGLSGRHNTKYDFNKNDCSAYSLSSCPKGAKCSKCPFGNRYKLNSCQDGWRISGNSCVAASCSALNSNYKSAILDNQICTKVTEGGLTCYKDCRAVSCDGYKINCDNGVSGSNITSSALCPDCMNDNAKCSPKLCKITACAYGYKVNADATKCIEKDDTCPNGYYKTCETSTVGNPKYTEKGTACYQCKAKEPETCSKYVEANFSDYTRIGSTSDLQHALIDGKNNFVVVNDFTLNADVDLSGKTIMGANEIASASPLCANTPKITTEKSIKTSNQSVMKNLHFINNATNKNSSSTTIALISGGGSFHDLEFSVQNNSSSPFVGNTYNTHILVTGIANIYNIKANSSNKVLSVGTNGTLNIKGTVSVDNTPLTDSGWEGSPLTINGNNTTINLENGSTFNYTGASDFIRTNVAIGSAPQNATININGKVNWKKTSAKYARHLFWDCIKNSTINLNHENIYYGSLSMYCGANTANINAKTTINIVKKTDSSSQNVTQIIDMDGGKININAPLIANGPAGWEEAGGSSYDGMLESDYTYINSEVTVDAPVNLHFAIGSKLELGPNAYIKGIGRIYFHKVTTEEFIIKSGAKLQFSGGTCKRATSNKTLTPTSKSDIDWRTPQSPFTGGC